MAIIYLFILKLGLVSSVLLLLIESVLLMAYIIDFRNLDHVIPRDFIGLFSFGQDKLFALSIIFICSVLCSWIHKVDIASESSANVSFWLLNLIIGMSVSLALMLSKSFRVSD
jgi:hypothetical protein